MVWDPITKDWVPRWGARSIKKIEKKHEWLIEEKPGDVPIEKQSLFEQRAAERNIIKEKQSMRTMKNKLRGANVNYKDAPKERQDKKVIDSTLKFAQKSTASMGKHDRKAHPDEELNSKRKVTKVNTTITSKDEKSRSMNILSGLKRKREAKEGIIHSAKSAKQGFKSEDKASKKRSKSSVKLHKGRNKKPRK